MTKVTIKKIHERKNDYHSNTISVTFKSAEGKTETITLTGKGKLRLPTVVG